jgi:hypothetical protein
MTLSIMTLSIMTLSVMTLSIMTLSLETPIKITLSQITFSIATLTPLSVAIKPKLLTVIMPSVVRLDVVASLASAAHPSHIFFLDEINLIFWQKVSTKSSNFFLEEKSFCHLSISF